jgi:hypothetical protein
VSEGGVSEGAAYGGEYIHGLRLRLGYIRRVHQVGCSSRPKQALSCPLLPACPACPCPCLPRLQRCHGSHPDALFG